MVVFPVLLRAGRGRPRALDDAFPERGGEHLLASGAGQQVPPGGGASRSTHRPDALGAATAHALRLPLCAEGCFP